MNTPKYRTECTALKNQLEEITYSFNYSDTKIFKMEKL